MYGVVAVAIHVPYMGHFVFFQIGMNPLADPDQSVFIAAG
jgi:hypothetical protein